ncbi:MAG: ATP-dependent zinc protease [Beutenbergiaceae bacterium]
MCDVVELANPSTLAGWREWVCLPELEVAWIKAKLDTGARSSAIHASQISEFDDGGVPSVRFVVHPWQGSEADPVTVRVPVLDRRVVRSSNGQAEERLVVPMTLRLLQQDLVTEVTLSNRDQMGFRLLIGREALRGRIVVDSGRSYIGGRPPRDMRRRNRGR